MPSSSAACSVTSPIVPAPITTARATPGGTEADRVHAVGQRLHQRADARRHAVREHARIDAARTLTRSANAPGTWTPTSMRCLHTFE